jgi:hypothetical protein
MIDSLGISRLAKGRGTIGLLTVLSLTVAAPSVASKQFEDITAAAGVSFDHRTTETVLSIAEMVAMDPEDQDEVERLNYRAEIGSWWLSGGVAVGDYDADQLPDIFAIGGNDGVSRLFQNQGDGTFIDKATLAGVADSGERLNGAMFIDYDGDGDLDLFVGGLLATKPRLYRNDGDNGGGEVTFTDVFDTAFPAYDVDWSPNNYGGSLGDIDLDGDLDFVFSHSMSPWGPKAVENPGDSTQHLWRNDRVPGGETTFSDISNAAGISAIYEQPNPQHPAEIHRDQTYAVNFADINEDGYPDLLFANDNGQSRILINDREGRFTDVTDHSQFTDNSGESTVDGMGAAVGDFDSDGHFDWFISQIRRDEDGNRLYKGRGDGTFIDLVSETQPFPAIGVENGHWGWGACFADLNNDRHLDIFDVNGPMAMARSRKKRTKSGWRISGKGGASVVSISTGTAISTSPFQIIVGPSSCTRIPSNRMRIRARDSSP